MNKKSKWTDLVYIERTPLSSEEYIAIFSPALQKPPLQAFCIYQSVSYPIVSTPDVVNINTHFPPLLASFSQLLPMAPSSIPHTASPEFMVKGLSSFFLPGHSPLSAFPVRPLWFRFRPPNTSLFQTWSSAFRVVSELHARGWVEATYNVLERTRLPRAVGHVQSIFIGPAVTFPSRVGRQTQWLLKACLQRRYTS